jgi:drug/metabolite transporter (DMT)-like permease
MLKNYLLILLTVLISVTAQTFLKTGMNNIGNISDLSLSALLPLALKMVTNIFVITGLSLYVVGTFFWLVLLSRLDLSFLYPFGALQYFFVFLVSYFLLGETIRPARIIGVAIIMIGIFIIGKWG